jgi:hypothetical protein
MSVRRTASSDTEVTVMADYPVEAAGRRRTRRVDAGRLWTGGLATAVIAALVAMVGILIARGILSVPLLAPNTDGTWGDASTPLYCGAAFLAALVATALLHVLLLVTPQPFVYFGWIVGLLTIAAAVEPFTTSAELASKMATGVINAFIGLAIGSLLVSTGQRSIVVAPYEPEH